MDGYDETTYGERMADIYDDIQGQRDAPEAVEYLASHGPRRALELGVGTGRVAIPLATRGVHVTGLDSSGKMLDELRRRPGGDKVVTVLGTFADLSTVSGAFDVVYVVFGTLFCLPTAEEQIRCFAEVAEHLAPSGSFVVEASVPDFSQFNRSQNVRISKLDAHGVIATFTEHNRALQTTMTQHVMITEAGFRLMPVYVRYCWPSELDLMARLAGLELESRWADFRGASFISDSGRHVSVYRRS